MDLSTIYQFLNKSTTYEQFMIFNNIIHNQDEEYSLTNNRKSGNIEQIKAGKNKILALIDKLK